MYYEPMAWHELQGDNLARLSDLTIRLLEKTARDALEGATIQLGPEARMELNKLNLRQRSVHQLIPQNSQNLERFRAVKVTTNEGAPF